MKQIKYKITCDIQSNKKLFFRYGFVLFDIESVSFQYFKFAFHTALNLNLSCAVMKIARRKPNTRSNNEVVRKYSNQSKSDDHVSLSSEATNTIEIYNIRIFINNKQSNAINNRRWLHRQFNIIFSVCTKTIIHKEKSVYERLSSLLATFSKSQKRTDNSIWLTPDYNNSQYSTFHVFITANNFIFQFRCLVFVCVRK